MGFADIGGAAFRARYAPPPTVGLVNPVAFDVDAAARQLLGEYQARLLFSDPLRQEFEAWFTSVWAPFFASQTGLSFIPGRRLIVTDAAAAALQTHRSELVDLQNKLVAKTSQPSSTVVPPDPRTLPPTPKPPSGGGTMPSWWPNWAPKPPTLEVPWWVWVGGTLVTLAAGYGLYRSWQKQREIQQSAFRVLPGIFSGSPAAYGEVAQTAARDAAPAACGCPSCSGGH